MARITLNRRLVLETPEQTPDGAGGYRENWVEAGTLWANLEARSARRGVDGTVPVSSMDYIITVRATPYGAPSRPRPDQRFRDGVRVFKIEAVVERDPLSRFLTCYAQQEVAV